MLPLCAISTVHRSDFSNTILSTTNHAVSSDRKNKQHYTVHGTLHHTHYTFIPERRPQLNSLRWADPANKIQYVSQSSSNYESNNSNSSFRCTLMLTVNNNTLCIKHNFCVSWLRSEKGKRSTQRSTTNDPVNHHYTNYHHHHHLAPCTNVANWHRGIRKSSLRQREQETNEHMTITISNWPCIRQCQAPGCWST